ncbi:MAG: CPBP family intramembrane metalloprotease [Treponemataceae bacterium]|nr:CPBP family intramembrane metalloprotease [Treponemataceae bacterium]
MEQKRIDKKRITILYLIITVSLTWLCQFMPILMGMDVENTSISSFDYSSIFFGIGGVMPTLVGVIFVFIFYTKEGLKDFLKRCFVPNKECIVAIVISLGLICFEVAVTQLISKGLGAEALGFEGLKLIAKNPLYFFYFLFWGIISGPFSEEFGWRGFLTDRLFNKEKLLNMSLLIGFVWGIWHLPLYFYPAQIQHDWFMINPILGLLFIVSCMTAALVYTTIYVVAKRKIFPIFFLHLFKNIILTGAMIYPFSDTYSVVVVFVEIVMDVLFYVLFTRTPVYKRKLDDALEFDYLK